MELRHLRYFVTCAEEGSINRATERLNISQPAVSRQLRDLEEELGVKLFIRKAQGLKLTDDGETALIYARDLLRRSNAMMETFKRRGENTRKTIQVGYIPTALSGFLAQGLRRFHEEHAGVKVHIREMNPRAQEVALTDGEIDLALLGTASGPLKNRFGTAHILKTPLSIVLPNNHLLTLRKSINLVELEGESFVSLHERNFPRRPQLIADLSEKAGFAIEVDVKANGLSEALGLVAAGTGIAVLPADVDRMPHPGVVFVKMNKPRVYLTSSAVWRKDKMEEDIKELVRYLQLAAQE